MTPNIFKLLGTNYSPWREWLPGVFMPSLKLCSGVIPCMLFITVVNTITDQVNCCIVLLIISKWYVTVCMPCKYMVLLYGYTYLLTKIVNSLGALIQCKSTTATAPSITILMPLRNAQLENCGITCNKSNSCLFWSAKFSFGISLSPEDYDVS